MNTETKRVELLEVNQANIESTFAKITEYAESKGYRIMNKLKSPTTLLGTAKSMHFDSKRQKKALRNYINRIHKQANLRTINVFLHFLYKKIYGLDIAPSVELSEKEIKIQIARKAWKKVQMESDKLRLVYKQEKGDFYKQKSVGC